MKQTLERILHFPIEVVHFVGIGGSSMSGLASILLENHIPVTGSDMQDSLYMHKLKERGAKVFVGHSGDQIPTNASLVVYTAAISKDNPELLQAAQLGIPMMERADFLGVLTRAYPKTVAVAGTHGKTTSSSLIATLLYEGGLDPTVSVGGVVSTFGKNYRVGSGEYFVTEACEYVDSFLKSTHHIGIILNLEHEHVDYFKDLDQVKDSFRRFAEIVPADGFLIVNGDSPDVLDAIDDLDRKVLRTGLEPGNDYQATDIRYDDFGKPTFKVLRKGVFWQEFTLNIPGEHNVRNALAAIACADLCGTDPERMAASLKTFSGAGRRFEHKGTAQGITVVEDYAHHPTEVAVTIQACKNYKANRLIVVFQPHTFSRTYHFFDQLVEALGGADHLIVSDIYSDREKNTYPLQQEDLANAVRDRFSIPSVHLSDFAAMEDAVAELAQPGDFVLIAGAGTINKIIPGILEKLNNKTF
ncbi:UDP-N-acetylmuramate--L-alanine ligase [Alkalibacter rhizosphaerae]|uniref:UDP-N-acetylmuramate--L-alanine ligase n=1 Tax=Alkalibacter rhizosphaerae TaxID=2815577 RepID=UPI001FEFD5EE|nr:UDP-N-acetylmuramate--L-alanine ligase [Alkalibacter rhizosphaerae]